MHKVFKNKAQGCSTYPLKSNSISVIAYFTQLWGMYVVAMGSHLGFRVPYTSNNHETLFIQSVSFDLVGIDTLITRLGQ